MEIIEDKVNLLDKQYLDPNYINPSFMTKVFVNLLQIYFTRPEIMITERFKKKPNKGILPDEQTHVLITTIGAWRLDRADERPAILIRRLTWQPIYMGMGEGRIQYDPSKDFTEFMVPIRGQHLFLAHSREYGEVELLVEELLNLLLRLGPIIRRLLKLQQFRVLGADKASIYVRNRDYFVGPVVVQYDWAKSWIINKGIDEIEKITIGAIEQAKSEC